MKRAIIVLAILGVGVCKGADAPDATTTATSQPEAFRAETNATSKPAVGGTYYVISIAGHIGEDFTAAQMSSHLAIIRKLSPTVVVLEIDTNGGSVAEAEKIVDLLIQHPDVRVIAFVRKALSAGATISLACREIYVAQTATIGAAVSYISDGSGGIVGVSQDVAEKFQSAWRAVCRKAAQHGGHPALLAEAMVDKDFALTVRMERGKLVYERDGKGNVVKARGRILTLTADEAVDRGLAKGVASGPAALGSLLELSPWTRLQPAAEAASVRPQADVEALVAKVLEAGETQRLEELRIMETARDRMSTEAQRYVVRDRNRYSQIMQNVSSANAVIKALGEAEGIYIPSIRNKPNSIGKLAGAKVLQVIDAQQMLIIQDEAVMWLKGVPTAGYADGDLVQYSDLLHATGTQQYRSLSGVPRNVRVLEPAPVSMADIKRVTDSIQQARRAEQTAVAIGAAARQKLNLAEMYATNKRIDLALETFRQIISKWPDTPEAKTAAQRIDELSKAAEQKRSDAGPDQ